MTARTRALLWSLAGALAYTSTIAALAVLAAVLVRLVP